MVISSFVKGTWNVNHSSKCKVHACIIISNFFAYILDMTPLNHTIIYDLVTFGLVSFHICLSHFATFSLSTRDACFPHKFTSAMMWVNMAPLVAIFRSPQPAQAHFLHEWTNMCENFRLGRGQRSKHWQWGSSNYCHRWSNDFSQWMDCRTGCSGECT